MTETTAQLDRMIKALETLGDELVRDAANDVAEVVRDELRRTITAGLAPDGTALPKTQEGETPLTGAMKVLGVTAVGTTIYVRLTGPEARHHRGRARGGIVRRLIPVDSMPPRMGERIVDALAERFQGHMGGG